MCANCSLRNILLELYRQFRSNELLVKYKQISQLCSKSIKDLIAQGENDLISDGKLGNFYKYINHKLNGSSGIGPLLNSSGEIVHSAHSKLPCSMIVLVASSQWIIIHCEDDTKTIIVSDPARLPSKIDSVMSPHVTCVSS